MIAPAIAAAARASACASPGRCPPTPCSCPTCAQVRRDRRDVSRPGAAGAEGCELRPRRQRDAGLAVHRARRSITAPRSISRPTTRARARPIRAASSRRSILRSTRCAKRALTLVMQGHQARKRFGQNFLADAHYVARIVDAVDAAAGRQHRRDRPGPRRAHRAGWSTAPAASRRSRSTAISRRGCASSSRRTRSRCTRPTRSTFDFARSARDLRVVGNLPYNISSPLLFHLAAVRGAAARHPRDAAEGSRGAHDGAARRRRTTGG